MATSQILLFPDTRPLVERLGGEFFRQLPNRPGVYLMRDRLGTVVYVGKAKNLRQRLQSYRVANPDRVPKRLMRLLKTATSIEHQECADEAAALAREAELIRELKPRFNRAGVWPAPVRVLLWRRGDQGVELALREVAEEGWNQHQLLKGGAAVMFGALVRLLWGLSCPDRGLPGMPAGWFHGRLPELVMLPDQVGQMEAWVLMLVKGNDPELGIKELTDVLVGAYSGWQLTVLTEDLEMVSNYFRARNVSLLGVST